jgi:hypothetical protein
MMTFIAEPGPAVRGKVNGGGEERAENQKRGLDEFEQSALRMGEYIRAPFRRKCSGALRQQYLCRGHGLAYVTLRVVGDVD